MNKKIVVGMSGGVDSAVSALLLKRQGWQVLGVFMNNWGHDGQYCEQADQDWKSVQETAAKIRIDTARLDLSRSYWTNVFDPFLSGLMQGRTPNPDILCNSQIKFGACEQEFGIKDIAFGHYARSLVVDGVPRLGLAKDSMKDQTFYLSAISPTALQKTRFPVGNMLKAEVKLLARSEGLAVAERKESMGICFVGKKKFSSFVSEFIPSTSGHFVNVAGEVIGNFDGGEGYVVGEGARISGLSEKWYIAAKDLSRRTILVVPKGNERLKTKNMIIKVYWINGDEGKRDVGVRIRGQDGIVMATLVELAGDSMMEVQFKDCQSIIAKGQGIAIYRDGWCLGGGQVYQERVE